MYKHGPDDIIVATLALVIGFISLVSLPPPHLASKGAAFLDTNLCLSMLLCRYLGWFTHKHVALCAQQLDVNM